MSFHMCSRKCSKAVFPGGYDGFIVMSLLTSYIGNSHVILLKIFRNRVIPICENCHSSFDGHPPKDTQLSFKS